jgi:hypothetical protein
MTQPTLVSSRRAQQMDFVAKARRPPADVVFEDALVGGRSRPMSRLHGSFMRASCPPPYVPIMKIHTQWRLLAVLLLGGLVGACGDDDGNETGPAPEGHTVSRDGVLHMPGLTDPVANCTGCHGADLRGGTEGQPSCYRCHGEKW